MTVRHGKGFSHSNLSRFRQFYLYWPICAKVSQHHDIGQMNMYLGYFAAEEYVEGDNPPVGIILSRNKVELVVEYATY